MLASVSRLTCVRLWEGKEEAPCMDEACHTREMENLHMQVCSIWKCTKGRVLAPWLLQCVGLCPGEVVTVNTAQDLSNTFFTLLMVLCYHVTEI